MVQDADQCRDATSCRTLFLQSDLGVVGSEAGEVLFLVGDQRQQHDVSRRQEGQRGVRVSALSEEEAHRRVTRAAVRRANISFLLSTRWTVSG